MGEYPSFRYCFFSPRSFASFQPIEQKTKKSPTSAKKYWKLFFDLFQVKQIQQILWNTNQTNKTLKD